MIDKLDNIKENSFCEACYDQNSTDELIDGLLEPHADKIDLNTWNITATEWRYSLALALKHKIADMGSD